MSERVVLVDWMDRPVGTEEKLAAHRSGELHRAFSVLVANEAGEWLLQRRASGKYHSGSLWSNTCCSHPRPDRDLEDEARRLSNSEELISLSGEVYRELYASEDSLVDRLGQLRRSVAELADIDTEAEEFIELYETGLHSLQELGRRLGEYQGSVDHDPARLDAIRSRLDEIYRLQRKYGDTIEEVLAEGREARRELDRLEGSEEEIRKLEERAGETREELVAAAEERDRARREAAERLEEEITAILPELGMDEGRFEVHFEERDEPGPHGAQTRPMLILYEESARTGASRP